MKVAIKFFEKTFRSEDAKEAYLRACKWAAKYVVSKKVEVGETFWNIAKVNEETDLPTYKVDLYAMMDVKDCEDNFCSRCKEFHKSFFLNQQYNCDKCNMRSYIKQVDKKLEIKKAYRKERLSYLMMD